MKPREKFLHIWKSIGGPKLVEEHRFHPKRRWKHDFFIADSPRGSVAIEIEGGIWLGRFARHTNPAGYWRDCEKYNESLLLGNKVIRLAGPLIHECYITRLVLWLRGGEQPTAEGILKAIRKSKSAKDRDKRTSR